MIQLFSTNTLLKNRLKNIDIPVAFTHDLSRLDTKEMVITDTVLVETLLNDNADFIIFVLTPSPNFHEGTSLLARGIKGYGNTFMHAKHLRRAIVTIKEGNIWLPPSLMQELITRVAPQDTSQAGSPRLETLTKRQRETALLIQEGLSNKEIAQKLHITERTVKAHISAIFERTGTTDRLSLAMHLNEQ